MIPTTEKRDNKMLADLQKLATSSGVVVTLKSEGHFHIQGALLVNYWPFASARTAYIANTTKARKNVSGPDAIAMARKLPPLVTDFKRKGYRAVKLKMLRKHPFCHWCSSPLIDETATVEHVIPLSRGGLDNDNNRKLACTPCNNKRGNEMPEIVAGVVT